MGTYHKDRDDIVAVQTDEWTQQSMKLNLYKKVFKPHQKTITDGQVHKLDMIDPHYASQRQTGHNFLIRLFTCYFHATVNHKLLTICPKFIKTVIVQLNT